MAMSPAVNSAHTQINDLVLELATALQAHYIPASETQLSSNDNTQNVSPSTRRVLVPVGLFGHGVWRPCDSVHLVCATENSQGLFWDYVAENLQIERAILGKIDDATLALSSLSSSPETLAEGLRRCAEQHRIKIYLHYTRLPINCSLSQLSTPSLASPFPVLTSNDRSELHHWSMVRDAICMRTVLTVLSSLGLHTLYDSLRRWADSNGVFGQQLGIYLGSESLFWFAVGVIEERIVAENEIEQALAGLIGSHLDEVSKVRRLSSQLGIELPESDQGNHTDILVASQPTDNFRKFLSRSSSLAKMDAMCWASLQSSRLTLLEETTASCMQQAVEHGRVWAKPMVADDTSCTYAVGLDGDASRALASLQDGAKTLSGKEISLGWSLTTADELEALFFSEPPSSTSDPPNSTNTDRGNTSGSHDGKMRTAKDMLSRLRHDPAHMSVEYEVGYLDRFEGIKWLSLEEWGNKPVEEETFIPLTRIRMFRRREDRVVIWERGKRPSDGAGE